jgi:hypothetical protein
MQFPVRFYIDVAPTALNTPNIVRQPAFAKGYGGPEPMFVRQTSGHFSKKMGTISVRHERYFFTISQQKPGKRNFGKK